MGNLALQGSEIWFLRVFFVLYSNFHCEEMKLEVCGPIKSLNRC